MIDATLTPRPDAVPVVGRSRDWAVDFAVVGGLLPVCAMGPWLAAQLYEAIFILAPLGGTVSFDVLGQLAGLCVAGAVLGAGLGAAAPVFLERVRGQVPLPLLGVLAVTVAATWGFASGGLAHLLMGAHPMLGVLSAVLDAVVVGGMILPYTMAVVFRKSTTPVVLATLVMSMPLTAAMYRIAWWWFGVG